MEAEYILGLDIGANSIGWAILGLRDGEPASIEGTGARVFPEGVEVDRQHGTEKPRNQERREKRLLRRQIRRRAKRLKRVLFLLMHYGLLPKADVRDPVGRMNYFRRLDLKLMQAHCDGKLGGPDEIRRARLTLPYRLRAAALDRPLALEESGRAIYHLAHRRGFATNRKSPPKKGEEDGKVQGSIKGLDAAMQSVGARTYGEYFSRLDPEEERIRNRYTARERYMAEFDRIWEAQAQHHPGVFTERARIKIRKAVFAQKPLKSVRDLIGRCSLEANKRRAPWADFSAQRFRMLQRVNDLLVVEGPGRERPLTTEERDKLLAALDRQGSMEFTKARKLLGLVGTKFNLEAGGEKKLPGNTLNARLSGVFGEAWYAFSPERQEAILQDMRSIQNEDHLERRGKEVWGLAPSEAKLFAETRLEAGYARHCRKAMRALMARMEDGTAYATAKKALYPRSSETRRLERLPPLASWAGRDMRNPIVSRCLNELRKVVNAIIERFGPPSTIRVELARDLKRSAPERERAWKRNRENQRQREEAAAILAREHRMIDPRRSDIEKAMLAIECGMTCPYTGEHFGWEDLFSSPPRVDVEHILPFSRALDNTYLNKTLCMARENRERKRGRTPHEAYHDTPGWEAILEQVKSFQGHVRQCGVKSSSVEVESFRPPRVEFARVLPRWSER